MGRGAHPVVSGPALADVTAVYTLRRMAQRDLTAILEIERVSFPSPWSLAGFERELATAWAVPTVALEDGPVGERVVGYACAWYVAAALPAWIATSAETAANALVAPAGAGQAGSCPYAAVGVLVSHPRLPLPSQGRGPGGEVPVLDSSVDIRRGSEGSE